MSESGMCRTAFPTLDRNSTFASLPSEGTGDLLPEIQARVRVSGRKVVVLDDDPTGTQTVHNVEVLTEWSIEALQKQMETPAPAFFVLTNSRCLSLPETQALHRELGQHLVVAAARAGREFVVISRSDSTLRGHFPGEVEALAEALGADAHAWILVPFFLEGGRYTLNDVHYVAAGASLVPAGETEFARDAVFGYKASNLRAWVEEKTGGRIPAAAVCSISLEDIRRGGPAQVADQLCGLHRGAVCIVNAVTYRDIEVFTAGLLDAEARGRRFIYRTAASFVRVRSGIAFRPLLGRSELDVAASTGALFVVGSHVGRTTQQLDALLRDAQIKSIEINVSHLLDDERRASEIEQTAARIDGHLAAGQDVVVFTSRKVLTHATAEGNLAISQRVSSGLVAVVQHLRTRPRYLVAKGGITSSDIASKGLGVRRARVRGQILPGVPVWELGPESRHPGLIYVVFPGNVGEPNALATLARSLRQ